MSTDDSLFPGPPPTIDAATGAPAWWAAMLEVECALAAAEEDAGMLPAGTARAISDAAARVTVDPAVVRDASVLAGTPVVLLVARLAEEAGEAGAWVHLGATSQDIMDTALALVARESSAVLFGELRAVVQALSTLAREHRHSVMAGRTLLQQGEPTTFGLKAAGWLVGLVDAADGLSTASAIPVQLGGPVGTLAVLGEHAHDVIVGLARRLELPVPTLPWHTQRAPVARLGSALGITAGTIAKVAGDLVLLAQTEVAEVAERREPGRGASSSMPHKHNPVACVGAIAAARRAAPLAGALLSGLDHEHERAAGAWQAEAPLLVDLFRHVAHAAASLARALDGLEVDPARMRANLDAIGMGASPTLGDLFVDPLVSCGPVDRLIDAALARWAASSLDR